MTAAALPGRLTFFLAGNVLFGAGLFFHAFLYNFYIDHLGFDEAIMGTAAAALTAGGLVALLPAGRMVDKLGPRAAVAVAVLLATSGLVWGAVATTPITIYLAALLAGAGAGSWRVAMPPIVMELTNLGNRSRIFSWNVGLLVGSGALWMASAGALSTWLSDALNVSPLSAIRLALILGVLGTAGSVPLYALAHLPSAVRISSPPIDTSANVGERHNGPGTLSLNSLVLLVAFVALWMTAPALIAPFFNIYFWRHFAIPVSGIGLIFALAHAAAAVVIFGSGEIANRFGPRRTLAVWMLFFGPVVWALAGSEAVGVAVTLYVLQGMVSPATNPLIDQILLERAPLERRGAVSSWRNAATEGSGVIGASVGGVVLAGGTFGLLFVVAGALGLAAALCLILALARLLPSERGSSGVYSPS